MQKMKNKKQMRKARTKSRVRIEVGASLHSIRPKFTKCPKLNVPKIKNT